MKKVTWLLIIVLFILAGCSNNEVSKEKEIDNAVGPSAEEGKEVKVKADEDDKDLKEKAVKADFVKINAGMVKEGVVLKATLDIDIIYDKKMFGEITAHTEDGEEYEVYNLINYAEEVLPFDEGDTIEIWGLYGGKGEDGIPIINVLYLESE